MISLYGQLCEVREVGRDLATEYEHVFIVNLERAAIQFALKQRARPELFYKFAKANFVSQELVGALTRCLDERSRRGDIPLVFEFAHRFVTFETCDLIFRLASKSPGRFQEFQEFPGRCSHFLTFFAALVRFRNQNANAAVPIPANLLRSREFALARLSEGADLDARAEIIAGSETGDWSGLEDEIKQLK
jgi:hypothetical protein